MCSLVIISASNYIGSCHSMEQTDYFKEVKKSIFYKWKSIWILFSKFIFSHFSIQINPKINYLKLHKCYAPKYIPLMKLTVCCMSFPLSSFCSKLFHWWTEEISAFLLFRLLIRVFDSEWLEEQKDQVEITQSQAPSLSQTSFMRLANSALLENLDY